MNAQDSCTARILHSNTTTSDQLLASRCVQGPDRFNVYGFEAVAGSRVNFTITGTGLTPWLEIRRLDGSLVGRANGSGSQVTGNFTPGSTAPYILLVGALDQTANGDITILNTNPGVPLNCVESDTKLCLLNRFYVNVAWLDFKDNQGNARVVPSHPSDSANLWFFEPANWEMLVKMKNACVAPFNRFWFFAGSTTNVGYSATVTDTATGKSKIYTNVRNVNAPAIVDTSFFTCN